jgi:hypothetical protein
LILVKPKTQNVIAKVINTKQDTLHAIFSTIGFRVEVFKLKGLRS